MRQPIFTCPQTKFAKVMFLQVSVCPQGGGVCAWLLPGEGGACMVAPGGCTWLLLGGACMVAPRGHAWLLQGGVSGCSWGGMRGEGGGHVW